MFPTAIPTLPLAAPKKETTASGAEVPMATTVIPITISEMPKREAILEAPSTKKLAPESIITRPAISSSTVTVISINIHPNS